MGYVGFQDFLIGTVDLERDRFISYCKTAYRIFYESKKTEINIQEMTSILCKQTQMNRKLVEHFMEDIDKDHSNSVTYAEFFEAFIINLDLQESIFKEGTGEPIDAAYVVALMEADFPALTRHKIQM